MSAPRPLSPAVRTYVAAVVAVGAATVGLSVYDLWRTPVSPMWLVLLALTCFSSFFAVRIPNVGATISVSETFVFTCALLYGPAPATVAIAVDGLVISCWRRHRPVQQILFNGTEPAFSLFVAAHVFAAVSGVSAGDRQVIDIGRNLFPLFLFTTTYFLLNTGLNATVVSLHVGKTLPSVWRQHFGWVLLNYFGAASMAGLLVHNSRDLNLVALGIVVPLIVISYLTFKTSMARVEEANAHLQELNKLYLSTIEALAMAVDAKDQITHGHIRRVQTWAVGLAKALGITDERQIKAIEAAALLHDMGKLAIPEHILNKPGKLSSFEFEQMKKHVTIGADMLSAIDFPYPVVPIVRHHHEQWNGRGYPDGISGADIPIGARILSVVDVFDALTSDRPYRRALTDEQAVKMLLDGRGKAFDPLVVDTFVRVYRDIAPRELEPAEQRRLEEIAAVARPEPRLLADPASEGSAADTAVLPIYGSLHACSSHAVLGEAMEEVSRQLRRLTPATLVALYVHDVHQGDLAVVSASGEGASHLDGVRVGVGERLTGWVAANKRTVCNSDAALDLAELPSPPPVPFQSCLSTPLITAEGLVGVISLYARDAQAFSEVHRRILEHTARPLAHLVRGGLDLERVQAVTGPGALAALPSAQDAAELTAPNPRCEGPIAAVSLQLSRWPAEGDAQAATAPEQLLARAAALLQRDLRVADLLYRDGPNGLLAVLPHADLRAAGTIADRARASLATALARVDGEVARNVRILTGVAAAPADGPCIDDLISAARTRACSQARDAAPATDAPQRQHATVTRRAVAVPGARDPRRSRAL